METKNVKIRINDRDIECAPTATVLEAALANGIDIPHMCYHPGMKVAGVCRVCQVEIKGVPKLQTSCSTPVREGMEVFTDTPAVQKARAGVVEFWLVNHPLDCPICDKGGECPLQDITYNMRGGTSRLRDPKLKRVKRKILGDHVIFDAERCILCWRCTRFTQEISGSNQLMLTGRGVRTQVDTPPGQVLDEPFSGNLPDVCPVGALTSRDFRFKCRPWEMTPVDSTCTGCAVGCSNTLWSKRGTLLRMTARPNLEVNDYWLCDRGRYDLGFVNDPARLRTPLGAEGLSTGDGLSGGNGSASDGRPGDASGSLGWDEAAHAFAALIPAEVRPSKRWAVFAAPHATNEEYFALQRFARGVLGTSDLVLDSAAGGGTDLTPRRIALMKSGRCVDAVTGIDSADVIVQVGGDLERTQPVYSLRVRKAVRSRGAHLFMATTDSGGLDGEAALRLPLEAGGEAALLTRLAAGPDGNEALGRIHAALTTAKRGVLFVNAARCDDSLIDAINGTLALNPGGLKVFVADGAPNLIGAWDAGFASGYFPGYVPVGAESAAARRDEWGARVPAEPGRARTAVIEAVKSGAVTGVVLYNSGRPWNWSPEILEAALRTERRIVFDIAPTAAARDATVIFPTPAAAEMDGTFTTPDHRVVLLRRAVAGPDRLWHPAAVLARVEQIATSRSRSAMPVDVFRDLTRAGAGYDNLNYGLLRNAGRPWQPVWADAPIPASGATGPAAPASSAPAGGGE